jgi:hypothetical protein
LYTAAKAGLWRFESSGEISTVAGARGPAKLSTWPVGSRQPVEGSYLVAKVQDTARPARFGSYDSVSASVAARVREDGILAAVAVPVIVNGNVWGMAAVGSVRAGPMPADTEALIAGFAELIATAVLTGSRDDGKLLDSLLQGRILDRWSTWDIAHRLGLPSEGPFVIIAAEASAVGKVVLPEIESKLRSLDVYSAWRVFPDFQVGIAHIKSQQQLDKVVALLSRTTAHRVGVSARFDDLRDTPQAFHVAKVTMRGRTESRVAVFDGSILATAAVSAPDVMLRSVGTVLDRFRDLDDEERELLFETFRVWQECDASMNVTAEALVCHPNTVRHRLRRIEQRTGRSLSRPTDLAELRLVFEVHRRLM